MDNTQPQYSIWLLPEAGAEQRLVTAIAELAASIGGEAFWPHVTIQGDITLPLGEIEPAVAQLASRIEIQRWQVQRLETSAYFFRCMYLRFDLQIAFSDMQADIGNVTRTARGLSPFPHLSLAYSNSIPAIDNTHMIEAKKLTELAIVFDRLMVARSSSAVPIAEWCSLQTYPLRAS